MPGRVGGGERYSAASCKDQDHCVLEMKVLTVTLAQAGVPFLLPASLNTFAVPSAPPFFRKVTLEKPLLLHISSNSFLSFWPPTAPSRLNPTKHRDSVYTLTTVLQASTI